MRFVSLTAHAFGPLNDSELEFAPGLNVIYGPNESGKSSWHAALCSGLCGIRRGAGQTTQQRRFKERFKPWDNDKWAVAVKIVLDGNGKAPREITLYHDLLGKVEASATDSLGRDVSNEIINGGSPDGSRWLGLDRGAFLATAAVRQADTLAVLTSAEELQGYLQRAAASIGGEQTAAAAIEAIDDFRKEMVGTTRANSKRPLRLAMGRLQDSREALAAARLQHDEYMSLHSNADEHRRKSEEAAARVRVAEAMQYRQKLSVLEERLGRAAELAAQFPDGEPPSTGDVEARVAAVVNALAKWESKPSVPDLDGEGADALKRKLDELPEVPAGDRRVDPVVREAQLECQRVAQDLRAHSRSQPDTAASPLDGTLSETELLDMASRLEVPEPTVDSEHLEGSPGGDGPDSGSRWGRPAFVLGAGSMAAGVALMAFVSFTVGASVLGAGLLLVSAGAAARLMGTEGRAARTAFDTRLIAQQVRREDFLAARARVESRAADLAVPADPAELRRLAQQVRRDREAAHQAAIWSEEHDSLEEEAATTDALLTELLADKGIAVDGDPRRAFDDYQGACDQREEQARLAAGRDALQAQLQSREQLEDQASAAMRAAGDAVETMCDLCRKFGIEPSNDGGAVAESLRGWQEEQEEAIEQSRRRDRAWTQLQELLGDDSLDNLLGTSEELRRQVLLYDDVPAEIEFANVDERELDETLRTLRRERAEAVSSAAGAKGRMEQLAQTLPSVPDAEVELDDAQHELARVQALDTILDQTRQYLSAAKERVLVEIAPVLSKEIAGRIATITDQRYSEVRVNPGDLSIQVRAPGGQWRNARNLSEGTREQIYLLLRVAMAKHVTDPAEACPLLLDDVTVQCDATRTVAVMDTLKSISEDHQVIMFTQEDDVLRWAEANLVESEHRIVELDPGRIRP